MIDFYDVAGKLSSAALGFIAGDVPGAYIGYKLYNSLPKSMKRKASGGGRPAKRARVTGPRGYVRAVGPIGSIPKGRAPAFRRAKAVRKACKGVKVPKKLAKQIRCVAIKSIHGEKPTGKYFKNYNGLLQHSAGSTDGQSVNDHLLYTANTLGPLSAFSVGEFRKIIDALSILWGTKTCSMLYSTTGNLSTTQMVVPAFSHYLKLEFRNNSVLPRTFIVYEVTPKEDTNNSVKTNWSAMSLTQKGGTTRDVLYHGMRPELYPQFRDAYKVLKKKTIIVAPGKSMFYYMSQSCDHIKFDNWVAGSNPINYRKGFTKELLVLDTQPACGLTGAAGVGIAYNLPSSDARAFCGVFATEIISSKCPENVDNINSNDNTTSIFTSSYAALAEGQAGTIVAPAISQPLVYY